MSIRVETVHTNGFSMDFFRFGRGKSPLVILPGLSVDSVMKYADAVAEAYALLTDDFTLYDAARPIQTEPATLTWIPYYAWANRSLGEMRVWVRR